jgi:methylmalonyl-CoA mutase cobalamin-binding subunit
MGSEPAMQDGNFTADGLRGATGGGIRQFAVDVVARLVSRESGAPVPLRETVLQALMAAVLASDADPLDTIRPDLRRARISRDMLAEHYIPEVARRLGADWDEDRASFVAVNIGVARLQAMLRRLGSDWAADDAERSGHATMLLIVPESEQHTLGAMVIAGWLRRRGISVCLRVAPTRVDLLALLAQRRFDGAMISVACNEKLDLCVELVRTLKAETGTPLRVAVGGSILGRCEDVAAATGADIVTNDLSLAIEKIGVTRQRVATAVVT